MSKKHILTAACCIALLSSASAMGATLSGMQSETNIEVIEVTEPSEEETTQSQIDGKQLNVPVQGVNSTETNYVQQSELTRKMIQEEKARNAKENDSHGFAITIIAMGIVIGALIILSLLFLLFGKISSKTLSRKKKEAHGVSDHDAEEHHEEPDSGEVIAAIGMALAEHFGQTHDLEDTILTIKRMRKAYSPWNSKIYNLRQMPEHATGTRRSLRGAE